MPTHPPHGRGTVGLAWFDRKQWQRMLEAAEDRSQLPDTYEKWQQSALEAVHAIESQGQGVERVHIEMQSLIAWCTERGLPLNGRSCEEYVAQLMQRRHARAKR